MFQSTRPRGARLCTVDHPRGVYLFQSTRPRGARPGDLELARQIRDGFNPRAHAGRDGNIHKFIQIMQLCEGIRESASPNSQSAATSSAFDHNSFQIKELQSSRNSRISASTLGSRNRFCSQYVKDHIRIFLYDHRIFRVCHRFGAEVLHPPSPVRSEIIESQTVELLIDGLQELGF